MKLMPLDIQQQRFRRALGGYDAREVDAFLDLISSAFEDLIRENHDHGTSLRHLEGELEDHRLRERTLKDTMISAQKIVEDIKHGARKEAEIVLAQAELQAEQIVENAHSRLVRVLEDIDELKRQRAQLEGSLQSVLGAHQKLLDATSERDSLRGDGEPLSRRAGSVELKGGARARLATVPTSDETPASHGESGRPATPS